jgi:AcrR family transcriptional regulator
MPKNEGEWARARSDGRASVATRERIVRAAAESIAEFGWGGVRTRAVAERAGVNAALVHYHFGTMDALLREAALVTLAEAMAEPMREILGAASFAEALPAMVGWIEDVDERSPAFRVLVEVFVRATYESDARTLVGQALVGFREGLAALIGDGSARGDVRSDIDPAGASILLAGLLDGLLLHRLVDPDIDLGSAGRALQTLFSPAVAGPRTRTAARGPQAAAPRSGLQTEVRRRRR